MSNQTVPSFEEIKASTPRLPEDMGGAYLVNGGEVQVSEAQLFELYLREYGAANALTVHTNGDGTDDVWSLTQKRNLTFCVRQNEFTIPQRQKLAVALQEAMHDWESAANIRFVEIPLTGNNCRLDNPNVEFVIGGTYQENSHNPNGSFSFFPSSWKLQRTLWVNYKNFGNIAPYTLAGVLRHELGHALGFSYEWVRIGSPACPEDITTRDVTQYDSASVMNDPRCGGTNTGDFVLTNLDRVGAAAVYGATYLSAPGDYDGDGITDLSVKDNDGKWKIDYAVDGFNGWDDTFSGYGNLSGVPVPADYDGDGVTDLSIRDSNGTWFIDYSSVLGFGGWNKIVSGYGDPSSVAVPADYDGDGKADLSVKDKWGYWRIDYAGVPASSDPNALPRFGNPWEQLLPFNYGDETHIPVPGDYNADGAADVAIKSTEGGIGWWRIDYRDLSNPATPYGGWNVQRSGYGNETVVPVPADYDGDGMTDIAIKSAEGTWFVDYMASPQDGWNVVKPGYGADAELVPGRYDGPDADGVNRADIAISSPDGNWYIDYARKPLEFGAWNEIVLLDL